MVVKVYVTSHVAKGSIGTETAGNGGLAYVDYPQIT